MKKNFFLKFIAVTFFVITTKTVSAQDAYIGEIRLFAGTFAPRGWLFCNGQTLPISQNSALFSLLGTTYGGNGQTTFGLPDLRGRVPMGTGKGPGLSDCVLGEQIGTEAVTLLTSQLPAHTHTITLGGTASGDAGNKTMVAGAPAGETKGTAMIQPTGSSQPVSIMQPSLGINYIICINGIFPLRQ